MTTTVRQKEEICVGCGAQPERNGARYCLVCGKELFETYQPLDRYRSAHHLHGKAFLLENVASGPIKDLFEMNRNKYSETAWASCVYSMVPYVGVVFIPFTLLVALIGIGFAWRKPLVGGMKLSGASFGLSFVILGLQVLLWALLYIVPELNRNF